MESVLSFAGLPFCSDLDKLDSGIAVIGIPYGTPYDPSRPPHALNSPSTIRRESNRYPDDPIAWDFDLNGTLLGNTRVPVVDCGDLPGDQGNPQGTRQSASNAVEKILNAGAIPLVLGGDDSIPIPVLNAYKEQEPFYVLQLDAHIDWANQVFGISEGYSSTMRRASEMPWVKGITQVGMRGVGSACEEDVLAAQKYGAHLISSQKFHKVGPEIALKFIPENSRCFITLDFDVLDPSVMPAVCAPTPGGLSYLDIIEIIQAVSEKTKLIGTCLVELAPEEDVNSLGAITAMRIAWNFLGILARNLKK
jgi:agmatinase